MATLTQEPRVRTAEPWMPAAENDEEDYLDKPLPDGWEEELKNDPEFMAELYRRIDRIDAEVAAGTWVGRTTEEVFDRLHKKYPHVFGVENG